MLIHSVIDQHEKLSDKHFKDQVKKHRHIVRLIIELKVAMADVVHAESAHADANASEPLNCNSRILKCSATDLLIK